MDVSQYLEIFIDETQEHLQNLSESLLVLEKEPDNKDTINEIFRAAHSLKGMAGTMGYKRMQHLTHDMENVFQEIRSEKMSVTASLIDVLFQCLDALDIYLENIKASSDEGTDDNEPILKQLNQILEGNDIALETGVKSQAVSIATETVEKDKYIHKFLDIDLDDKQRDNLFEAEDNDMMVYGITVYIQETCLLKAARAFLVIKEIEEIGEVIKFYPSSQDIEDEHFEFDFSFYMASKEPLEKIIEAAKSVSEIEEVVGACVKANSIVDESVKEEEAKSEITNEQVPQSTAPVKTVEAVAPKAKVAQPQGKQTQVKPVTNRTVRVDIEKLDALMNQVSELIIAKNSLVSISSGTDEGAISSQLFHEQIEYLERITTNLHESVMKVRMVPIESVVNKFPRMIRDLTKKLDKKMELYMSGEDTELDRTVVDEIGDPLQHLLRNSADHGLESTELRRERGKPEVGSIHLDAYQEGNNVIIEVSDDGNGMDTDKIKEVALSRGTITQEQAEIMSQQDIVNLLFLPSFSMAKQISDISGRGVGLDVVKSKIAALGGDVEVRSTLGVGSKFTVRLPLTLAIIQALMVEVREEKYAIALGSIQSIEDINTEEIKYVQAKEVIHIRGTVIPIVRLENVLDIDPQEEVPTSLTIVIVKNGDKLAGLVVDNLIGQQEIVIKSLGKYIDNNKLISGATILGDGEVALILDVNTLM